MPGWAVLTTVATVAVSSAAFRLSPVLSDAEQAAARRDPRTASTS